MCVLADFLKRGPEDGLYLLFFRPFVNDYVNGIISDVPSRLRIGGRWSASHQDSKLPLLRLMKHGMCQSGLSLPM